MSWISEYGTACFVACFLGLALRLVYNVQFHPLRSYPGPWLAKASSLHHLYYYLHGRNAFQCLKLHEIYGDVVRITPNTLSYITEDAWRIIYRESN